ncbi:MAG: hypothetical protein NDI61_07050 [Bdellovibrionaceae bacterium]|nr:hypothetical protein [Pseudobdellovibrionaceae bacterium]
MRSSLLCILINVLALFSSPAQAARSDGFGLGLILGSPTAITGKMYMNSKEAWDAGLAYDLDDSFTIYGDYLHHWPNAFAGQREQFLRELTPYVGIGGLFHDSTDPYRNRDNPRRGEHVVNLILRVPLGIEWMTPKVPLGVFIELVPGIFLAPEVDSSIMGGVGLRYYFD